MALTETVVTKEREVLEDGRIRLIEESSIHKDGVFHSARRDERIIEVGADVSAEDSIVQDMALTHTPERIAARQVVLEAEAEAV